MRITTIQTFSTGWHEITHPCWSMEIYPNGGLYLSNHLVYFEFYGIGWK